MKTKQKQNTNEPNAERRMERERRKKTQHVEKMPKVFETICI